MGLFQKYKKSIFHFIKFMAVGVVNFLVDLGVLTLLHSVIGLPVVPSNIVSYSCGVVNSYILNRFWTFKIKLKFFTVYTLKSGRKIHFLSVPFLKFIFVNLISLGVNTLAMYILVDLYSLNPTLSKIAATFFSFIVNFAGSKLLVFKENGGDTAAGAVK
jgi:putative flippase GtrA